MELEGYMEMAGLSNFAKRLHVSRCLHQELVGHLPVERSFVLCKFLSCEGCSLELLRERGF